MNWLGYLASVLIGVSLGLIGGGGSILTIPVLVYLFGINPVHATGYSLFIVGTTSLAGAIKNYLRHTVNVKAGIYFSLVAATTVLIIRKFVLHDVPENLFSIGTLIITKSLAIMVVFSILMLLSAIRMIFYPTPTASTIADKFSFLKLFFTAFGIGCVTGFLGAGGGFLIIPALIFIFRIPVKEAIGTSLLIISINSLVGVLGDLGNVQFDWTLLLTITTCAIAGMFVGFMFNTKTDADKLKKYFGWFVLVMAVYIILKELPKL